MNPPKRGKPAPKLVNIIEINDKYRAEYSISNFGWALQRKKDDAWENICYPDNFKNCVKKAVEIETYSRAKNLKEVLYNLNKFEAELNNVFDIRLKQV